MPKEYISRKKALKFQLSAKLRPEKLTAVQAVADAIAEYIKSIPAADVVAVVRCRECVFGNMPCATARYPDYFCADGKRKDGGQDDV